jgi:branched-chain amino acid transport system permease protein
MSAPVSAPAASTSGLLSRVFPQPTRDLALPTAGVLVMAAVFVGGGSIYAAVLGGSSERLVTTMFINAIVVVGLQLYIGNTGVLSFGHIGFGAIAGYVFALAAISPDRKAVSIAKAPAAVLNLHLGVVPAGILAVAVALVVAVVVGLGLARSGARSGAVAATVITLALLFVTHELALSLDTITGGDRTGLAFKVGSTLDSNWPIVVALVASLLVARLFAQSRWGRLANAAREDDLAARAIGINPQAQQMLALLLSVAIVAVAASLRIYEAGNITPKFFFFDYTLLTLVMLIVGGRNSLAGGLVGVVVITAAREGSRRLGTQGFEVFGLGLDGKLAELVFREGLSDIVLGLAMLGFMVLKPSGLLHDWELDEWLHRRLRRADPAPEVIDPPAPATVTARLLANGLTVDFGGFRALSDASIEASGNEVVGLIGPNGAGKTTLVNVITGMVGPTSGTFSLDGADLTGVPAYRIARAGLVRTFQNLRLFGDLTVMENVEAAALVAERQRAGRPVPPAGVLLSAVGLWDQRYRRASALDYGSSRRLELARAAAMAPTLLLLDEPTSGMSDSESLGMVERVRAVAHLAGAGVLVIDHDLGFITGISDRIYVLDQGQVIATGTPAEIQADPGVQRAYLGSAAPVGESG